MLIIKNIRPTRQDKRNRKWHNLLDKSRIRDTICRIKATIHMSNNITCDYFQNFRHLCDANGAPLTNVYWSNVPGAGAIHGCIYLIHGYGGSPVEPILKIPMQYAMQHGFNVIAIEGVDLSATAGNSKDISIMTLTRQKQAIHAGLRFCREMPELNTAYNIAWVHSISSRALSDLTVDTPWIRKYFDTVVLNNPYFMPPPKVDSRYERIMRKDPSGVLWQNLAKKALTQSREIEHRVYQIPTCLYNLFIPVPERFSVPAHGLHKMTRFIGPTRVYFILGTADNMADYNQNVGLFNALSIQNKQLISIPDANHSFDNKLDLYTRLSQSVLDEIRSNILSRRTK